MYRLICEVLECPYCKMIDTNGYYPKGLCQDSSCIVRGDKCLFMIRLNRFKDEKLVKYIEKEDDLN